MFNFNKKIPLEILAKLLLTSPFFRRGIERVGFSSTSLHSLFFLIFSVFSISGFAESDSTNNDSNDNNVLIIAVSSSFLPTLKVLQKQFEAENPYQLQIHSASSGKLYAQILYRAPYSIFLTDNPRQTIQLEQQSQAVKGSRMSYAIGHLILYSSQTNIKHQTFAAQLKQAKFNRLAIANPKTSAYGLAARQTLKSLSLWTTLRSKIIHGENVIRAFQFINNKQAEIALISAAQINTETQGTVWNIPDTLYQPIIHEAILLNKAKSSTAALSFLEFLKSKTAQKIISQSGYSLPNKNNSVQKKVNSK